MATICMLSGILVMALPITVIGFNFHNEYAKQQAIKEGVDFDEQDFATIDPTPVPPTGTPQGTPRSLVSGSVSAGTPRTGSVMRKKSQECEAVAAGPNKIHHSIARTRRSIERMERPEPVATGTNWKGKPLTNGCIGDDPSGTVLEARVQASQEFLQQPRGKISSKVIPVNETPSEIKSSAMPESPPPKLDLANVSLPPIQASSGDALRALLNAADRLRKAASDDTIINPMLEDDATRLIRCAKDPSIRDALALHSDVQGFSAHTFGTAQMGIQRIVRRGGSMETDIEEAFRHFHRTLLQFSLACFQ